MHNDENYFLKKFTECGTYLNAPPSKLVSLKYREVRDHEYYTELLRHLKISITLPSGILAMP
jgi:hypothetical protein